MLLLLLLCDGSKAFGVSSLHTIEGRVGGSTGADGASETGISTIISFDVVAIVLSRSVVMLEFLSCCDSFTTRTLLLQLLPLLSLLFVAGSVDTPFVFSASVVSVVDERGASATGTASTGSWLVMAVSLTSESLVS